MYSLGAQVTVQCCRDGLCPPALEAAELAGAAALGCHLGEAEQGAARISVLSRAAWLLLCWSSNLFKQQVQSPFAGTVVSQRVCW